MAPDPLRPHFEGMLVALKEKHENETPLTEKDITLAQLILVRMWDSLEFESRYFLDGEDDAEHCHELSIEFKFGDDPYGYYDVKPADTPLEGSAWWHVWQSLLSQWGIDLTTNVTPELEALVDKSIAQLDVLHRNNV
jgi:hypothetical protein